MIARPRHAAVLLEVLISMALLLFGMAFVGMQVNTGLIAARHADIGMRAVMLTDSKIAELKAGVIQPQPNDQEIMGDFGIAFPGYTWRLWIEPTDIEKLFMVKLEVGYNEKLVAAKLAAPEQDTKFDDADNKIIQTIYRLVPTPADVNIERDFGITQAEIDQAMQQAGDVTGGVGAGGGTGDAGGGGGVPAGGSGGGGDTGNLDIAALMRIVGPFLQGGSFDPRMLSQLPEEDFNMIADLLEQYLQGAKGGNIPGAQQALEQLLNEGDRRHGRGDGQPGPDDGRPGAGPKRDQPKTDTGGTPTGPKPKEDTSPTTPRPPKPPGPKPKPR